MINNLEQKFAEKIDCHVNYNNLEEMKNLFEEANVISDESVFIFLEEIFRAPKYKYNNVEENFFSILNYVNSRFNHSLKWVAYHSGICILNGKTIPVRRVLVYMNLVKEYYGFVAILNIVTFSARFNSKTHMIDTFYDEIINYWNVIEESKKQGIYSLS